ncbi:uncharacterized protein LOC113951261 [Corapipo altera]|uniref:uncharacterized protein LOC113951261 n=1 Tax=Corapipo altera TaxID=415028 RepID=UPI000FD68B87|nr:uncharacterized protein LOC113951261 [Corapipo altera]
MLVFLQMMDRGGFLLGTFVLFCVGGTGSDDSYAEQLERLSPWNSHNVWVTLMKALNQTIFCASLVKPELPFHTFLVGAPVNNSDAVKLVSNVKRLPDLGTKACNASVQSCIANVNDWLVKLPVGIAPQELDILGTLTAAACFYFDYTGATLLANKYSKGYDASATTETLSQDLSLDMPFYQNASAWCLYTHKRPSPGVTVARQLPKGYFLICGNPAWPGIPAKPTGGPYTFGKLGLLTPTEKLLLNHSHLYSHVLTKRSLALDSKCHDMLTLWGLRGLTLHSNTSVT